MKLGFDIHGWTDKGPVRPANEDHILVGRLIKNRGGVTLRLDADDDFLTTFGLVCAVADGVGGEAGGATASLRTLHAFETQFYGFQKTADMRQSCSEGLASAGERANRSLLGLQAAKPELASMGCTLCGVCLTAEGPLAFNAGDSRACRWRDGFMKQLTQDESLTAMAVAANFVTAEQAARSDARHTILNAVGSHKFRLCITEAPAFQDGDCVLVCSDGLHDCVPLEKQEAAFSQGGTAEQIVQRLHALALEHHTRDNISIIVIRCVDLESPPPTSPAAPGNSPDLDPPGPVTPPPLPSPDATP